MMSMPYVIDCFKERYNMFCIVQNSTLLIASLWSGYLENQFHRIDIRDADDLGLESIYRCHLTKIHVFRKSHFGDETVIGLFYLHNGISFTGKNTESIPGDIKKFHYKILEFSFKKMYLKMFSAKHQPFHSGLNNLKNAKQKQNWF